jgi:DNA repair exonuclease SbcCD ATPase subunit
LKIKFGAIRKEEQAKREEFRAIREEEQAKREELQAIREKEQAKREELQAIREEEQAKREELRAIREEERAKREELRAIRELFGVKCLVPPLLELMMVQNGRIVADRKVEIKYMSLKVWVKKYLNVKKEIMIHILNVLDGLNKSIILDW